MRSAAAAGAVESSAAAMAGTARRAVIGAPANHIPRYQRPRRHRDFGCPDMRLIEHGYDAALELDFVMAVGEPVAFDLSPCASAVCRSRPICHNEPQPLGLREIARSWQPHIDREAAINCPNAALMADCGPDCHFRSPFLSFREGPAGFTRCFCAAPPDTASTANASLYETFCLRCQ